MKTALFILLAIFVLVRHGAGQTAPEVIPTADQMRVFLTKRPENDQIQWKDPARGGSLQVRILEVGDKGVSVQKTTQNGLVARVVPLADLNGISFAISPVEQRLLRMPVADAAPALRVLWKTRAGTLGMEGSNVGDFGIALARALRAGMDPAGLEEAASILDHLSAKEPAMHRKEAAKSERQALEMARALVAGPPEETDKVAWNVTEADDNPDAMLMATSWLGDRHFADLKKLQEEHPRWEEDDEVRPLRIRLYNLSLDFALYPSLFQGSRTDDAAAGLKKAWQVYQYTGETSMALQVLEDIAALYPDSQAAKDTAEDLARARSGRDVVKQQDDEVSQDDPASQENDPEEEGEKPGLPQLPPPPKRYNIFDD